MKLFVLRYITFVASGIRTYQILKLIIQVEVKLEPKWERDCLNRFRRSLGFHSVDLAEWKWLMIV